jgi:hypothetical protein
VATGLALDPAATPSRGLRDPETPSGPLPLLVPDLGELRPNLVQVPPEIVQDLLGVSTELRADGAGLFDLAAK